MRFDFVIFDLDGTIYDSLPVAMSALLRVLMEDGNNTVTMSDLQAWAGVPGHVTLSELGYRTPERMKSAADRWLRYVLEQGSAPVFPGMLDAVGELFARGVRIGIVTSRDKKIAHLLGGGSGVCPKEIEPYVETSVASGDTEKGKPSPDPILLAIEGSARRMIKRSISGTPRPISPLLTRRASGSASPRGELPEKFQERTMSSKPLQT